MPTKFSDSLQYLIDAVSGSVQINMPLLKQGTFPKDNTGTAIYFKGKTSVVFSFQLQKKIKAIKVWLAPASDELRNRYAITEKYLSNTGLNYFTGITYLKEALSLKNSCHDILVMDWVGRRNIKEYIIAHLDQKEKINTLADKLLRLHLDLNQAGIAHGHLHTGNIYIDAHDELKLIGYDALFIKGLMEEEAYAQVYPDYCHPAHLVQAKSCLQADYFNALIVYLGIKTIARDPVLWGRYKVGFQENFLFTATDFQDIRNAPVYKYLKKNQSPEIEKLLDILVLYCEEPAPELLKPFYTYLQQDLQQTGKSIAEAGETGTDVRKPLVLAIPANKMQPLKPVAITSATDKAKNKSLPVIVAAAAPVENDPALLHPETTARDVYDARDLITGQEEEMVLPNEKKSSIKKGAYSIPAKKHQKQFLIAGAVICAIIFAASYFLGGLADDINSPYVQKEVSIKEPMVEPVKKIVATPEQPGKPADLPAASKPEVAEEMVKKQVVDSLAGTAPVNHSAVAKKDELNPVAVSTENTNPGSTERAINKPDQKIPTAKIKKTIDPVVNIPVVDRSPITKNNLATPALVNLVNTKNNSHQMVFINERKSSTVKIKRPKKQADNSFAIGAPPKK